MMEQPTSQPGTDTERTSFEPGELLEQKTFGAYSFYMAAVIYDPCESVRDVSEKLRYG